MNRQTLLGFTIIDLLIVVAVLGLLAAVTVPSFVHARGWSKQDLCINNLRYIDGAKQEWAIDNKVNPDGAPVLDDIRIYLRRDPSGRLMSCPLDLSTSFSNSYTISSLTNAPACRINSTNHTLL